MGQSIRVILTGDLHVGRRPSRVSDHIDCRRCSCAAAWAAVVDYALQQKADVVAISGDLVDRENRFYEAFGPLERGLRRLSEAGIDTVAVDKLGSAPGHLVVLNSDGLAAREVVGDPKTPVRFWVGGIGDE